MPATGMHHKKTFLPSLEKICCPTQTWPRIAKTSETVGEFGAAAGKIPGDVDENAVLRQVLQRVGEELGLNERVLAQAVGEVPSFFDPGQATSLIAPSTYQRIGLMLRLHDSLSSLMGNDVEHMHGWMGALNRHTGGIPAKQLKDPDQLGKLVGYLEVFDC